MNRLELALHFHALTRISREELFGASAATCKPLNLPDDASTMFAGYVGSSYVPGSGLLLLAINPGGGGDAYTKRIPEDEVFYPLLAKFKHSDPANASAVFERINESFVGIVKGWNLWRILGPTLAAAGKNLDEVAYMNVVPYRTRQDKMPPVSTRQIAWSRIIVPTLALLQPRAVVTLGKKAGSIVQPLLDSGIVYYCVPRTIGDSYLSDEALEVHEHMRRQLNDT